MSKFCDSHLKNLKKKIPSFVNNFSQIRKAFENKFTNLNRISHHLQNNPPHFAAKSFHFFKI